ncbi:MAG: serine/threonine-protein kinase, partial [Planctomycetota bacterium]
MVLPTWSESTPGQIGDLGPPIMPNLSAEAYGALLCRQRLNPGNEHAGLRYAVEQVLGQGSGGAVWGALDSRLNRPIAIKVLNRGADLRGFVEEARITASLQHPNVLPIYDLDLTTDGDPCFVMKRNDGVSLGQALRQNSGQRPTAIATTNGIVNVFIGVGQALAYAHHQHIIHQDIKPDNILLGDFGEVLLVDWGCAVRGEARGDRLYGTPLYMAPEQARLEFADQRSDVYCLGGTLFHALVGRPPTNPDSDAKTFWSRKRAGAIDPVSEAERRETPPELLAIALKALAADPQHRYATVDEVLNDLRAYQSGLAVKAWREPLWHVLRRWYRFHRSQFWTAAVALVLVMAAGALWWQEKQREHASWRLVLSEDFTDRGAVEGRWLAKIMVNSERPYRPRAISWNDDPRVQITRGRLELGNDGWAVNVALRKRIHGDLRMEWDCIPLWNNENLNCFIGDDRTNGYTFHVGAFGDPGLAVLTYGSNETRLAITRLTSPLKKDKTYHFCLERESGRLRLTMNGQRIIDYDDPDSSRTLASQSVGFDTWGSCRIAISAVR